MCGIAGAVGGGPAEVEVLAKEIAAAQSHRGPDGSGLWSGAGRGEGHVALAHRRLAILDLGESASQPMRDARTGCVLSYNGEVYNFRELRRELEGEGARFRSSGDTEVVLQAWAHWGTAAFARLRGMFALAIWDPRDDRVVLARDRMGIKPLYLSPAAGDRPALFASEVRALLASGRIERRIDAAGLSSYLWNGYVHGPGTILRDVRQVPRGSWMAIEADGGAGAPVAFADERAEPGRDGGDAVERLRDELQRAVAMRLVSDVPLGIFLSGGIDSSAIAALAARTGPVTTFNVAFDEGRYDESPYARAVAAALGVDHREVRLSGDEFLADLDEALGSLDQPTFDAVNTFFVSRAVRRAGFTVALAGTGGDELFGGYASFRDLPRARSVLSRMPAAARHIAAALLDARHFTHRLRYGVPAMKRFAKLGDLLRSRPQMVDLYQVSYAVYTRSFLEEVRTAAEPDVVDGLSSAARFDLEAAVSGCSDLAAVSRLEQRCFLGERLLRDTDCTSMAVSLEVRVPLVDHALVAAAEAVDDRRRFEPVGRKQLLREIGLGGIDPALFERPKAGFELPFDDWIRGTLRERITSTFADDALCERVGLRASVLRRLWQAFLSGAPGIYWTRVWSPFVLLDWCRSHDVRL